MKVLAIGHPRNGVRWEHIAPYVGEQARSVWERYEIDQVREFYLRADHRPGVAELIGDDLLHHRGIVLAEADLHPDWVAGISSALLTPP